MLASYELYLENHLPMETYQEWCERMSGELDIEKINREDAIVRQIDGE